MTCRLAGGRRGGSNHVNTRGYRTKRKEEKKKCVFLHLLLNPKKIYKAYMNTHTPILIFSLFFLLSTPFSPILLPCLFSRRRWHPHTQFRQRLGKGYKSKFSSLGLNVQDEEIFSSSFAAAAYLEQKNFKATGKKEERQRKEKATWKNSTPQTNPRARVCKFPMLSSLSTFALSFLPISSLFSSFFLCISSHLMLHNVLLCPSTCIWLPAAVSALVLLCFIFVRFCCLSLYLC